MNSSNVVSASARHSLLGSDRTGGEWQIFSSVFLFLCCPQRNIYIYEPCYVRLPCADSCSFTIRSYRRRDATKREPPPREGYEVKNFPGGQFEYCWIRHRTKPLIGSGSRRDKWACMSATWLFAHQMRLSTSAFWLVFSVKFWEPTLVDRCTERSVSLRIMCTHSFLLLLNGTVPFENPCGSSWVVT